MRCIREASGGLPTRGRQPSNEKQKELSALRQYNLNVSGGRKRKRESEQSSDHLGLFTARPTCCI